jgi:hypothetical protein
MGFPDFIVNLTKNEFIADNGYVRGNFVFLVKFLQEYGWNFETDEIIDVNEDTDDYDLEDMTQLYPRFPH